MLPLSRTRFHVFSVRLTLKISGGQELICRRVNICPRPLYLDVRSLSTLGRDTRCSEQYTSVC